MWLNWACLGESSQDDRHSLASRRALLRESLEICRHWVAETFDRPESDVILTSSATEGCDLLVRATWTHPEEQIVRTNHAFDTISKSIERTARHLARVSGRLVKVGVVDIDPLLSKSSADFAKMFLERVALLTDGEPTVVVLEHVTSRFGLSLPVDAIRERLAGTNTRLVIDEAQAIGIGQISSDFRTAHFGCFHKYLDCPSGTGFAIVPAADHDDLPAFAIDGASDNLISHLPTQDVERWALCAARLSRTAPTDVAKKIGRLREAMLTELAPLKHSASEGRAEYRSHIVAVDLGSDDFALKTWTTLDSLGYRTNLDGHWVRVSLHHSLSEGDVVGFARTLRDLAVPRLVDR